MVFVHRVRPRTVADRLPVDAGISVSRLGICCPSLNSVRSSGLRQKRTRLWCSPTTKRLRNTDRGNGLRRLGVRLDVSEPKPSRCKRMESSAVPPEPVSTSREVRQENAFTQRAVYLAYQTDCQRCALQAQCLASGAKGDRARRISAVRRLLPAPAVVEHHPVMLGPIRWVDIAGRALRRTWMTRLSHASGRDPLALPCSSR